MGAGPDPGGQASSKGAASWDGGGIIQRSARPPTLSQAMTGRGAGDEAPRSLRPAACVTSRCR
jgi:hypothetical protein